LGKQRQNNAQKNKNNMSLHEFLDPQKIVSLFGLLGVIAIIFLETGVFFGFFFPGDSLLFTAGFVASQHLLSLPLLLLGVLIAAILGDSFGYWFGKKAGVKLFVREDSFFFKKKYVADAEHFYEKHGKKTIILARFIPIIRTFVPIVAGIGNMKYSTFLSYNIIGGALWSLGLTLFGFFLGKTIPNADKYLLPIIILIIVVSFVPPVLHLMKARKENRDSLGK